LRCSWKPPWRGGAGKWFEYDAQIAKLGNNRVMNVREASALGFKSTNREYMPLMYRRISSGRIGLYPMNEEAAAAAIRAHEIAGKIDRDKDGDVHVIADAESLDRFMATAKAAALLTDCLMVLTPVN
jgi:hypothetical protein